MRHLIFTVSVGVLAITSLGGCAFFKRSPKPASYNEILNPEETEPKEAELADNILAVSESGAILFAPEDTSFAGPLEHAQRRTQMGATVDSWSEEEEISAGPLALASGEEGPLDVQRAKARGRRQIQRAAGGTSGETIDYTVVKGDTLMEIAFETYANYLRWREIYSVNRDKMSHYTKMPIGTILTLHDVQYVVIRKEGKPYLIRKNDTLKTIAQEIYGDSSRWRELWKNNPELIKDPTKLYAGFTLYYQTDESRELREPAQSN